MNAMTAQHKTKYDESVDKGEFSEGCAMVTMSN